MGPWIANRADRLLRPSPTRPTRIRLLQVSAASCHSSRPYGRPRRRWLVTEAAPYGITRTRDSVECVLARDGTAATSRSQSHWVVHLWSSVWYGPMTGRPSRMQGRNDHDSPKSSGISFLALHSKGGAQLPCPRLFGLLGLLRGDAKFPSPRRRGGHQSRSAPYLCPDFSRRREMLGLQSRRAVGRWKRLRSEQAGGCRGARDRGQGHHRWMAGLLRRDSDRRGERLGEQSRWAVGRWDRH